MSTNSATPAPSPIKPRFYHTVRTLPSGKTGWCSHWSVVKDRHGNYRINPDAEVFYQRQSSEATMLVRSVRDSEIHIEWDFERQPVGTYDQPPADWPVVIVRGRGMRVDDTVDETEDSAATA